ncbi:PucR family transcriptional regulator [Blastococcus brunescens]|uniref:Helix-turn-helix domain-containing protein n=1 Tax=Blastococcus brunescens TaxID=1564165 RepID=A0ABZ1ATD6_9ACTN|nr:helix-turn-helix domain-containing protein [Blastococcus sp. BMG 8361]WRL61839.1 helix-turn-helix domain-containing protein [Blastococcus sp. BMG 8361]
MTAVPFMSCHGLAPQEGDQPAGSDTQLTGVNGRLLERVADLEWRGLVHETLGGVAASGTGATGVTEALHRLTGLVVTAEDCFGNLQAWAGPTGSAPPAPLPPRRRAQLLGNARRSPEPVRQGDRVVAVAQRRDEALGVLTLVDPEQRAGEPELFVLEHAATVLAIELGHRRSLVELELRLRRELMDDLLDGTDDESAVSRAQALGHDLRRPHQVLAVRWPGATTEVALTHALETAVSRVVDTKPLLGRRSGGVVAVLPCPDEHTARRHWNELYRAVTERLQPPGGAIGVGGGCSAPSGLPKSYAEARRALRVRVASTSPAGITVDHDLGIYRLLSPGTDDAELRAYVREWLGPLLDYDAASGTDLVMTLLRYLECGGNYDAAAHALVIHRSTLRYRLRRIREINGRDLGTVDTRLNMHVAARAWQMMQGVT